MSRLATPDESSPRYPGWRVVVACFLMALAVWGFGLYGHSVYLAELTRMRPNFSVAFVRDMHPFSRDMGADRYYEGLRKAGVPEGAA